MGKIEKAIVLLMWAVLAITMIPAVLPLIVGEASWILAPVLVIFAIIFPILVIWKAD